MADSEIDLVPQILTPNKEQHGQLLLAGEWFKQDYPDYEYVLVSVHPNNMATPAAEVGASYALTFEKLSSLVSEARRLLSVLAGSQLSLDELEAECGRLLQESPLRETRLVDAYLDPFLTSAQ